MIDMKGLWFIFGYDIFTGFKVEMIVLKPFYEMKLKTSKFKILCWLQNANCHFEASKDITTNSKLQALHIRESNIWWEWQPSLPHSCPLKHRYFTHKQATHYHPPQYFWPKCNIFHVSLYFAEDQSWLLTFWPF